MLDRVKGSLLFAFCCGIGAVIGGLIMGVYQEPVKYFQFFVVEIPVAFVFHVLLTLLSEKLKGQKQ